MRKEKTIISRKGSLEPQCSHCHKKEEGMWFECDACHRTHLIKRGASIFKDVQVVLLVVLGGLAVLAGVPWWLFPLCVAGMRLGTRLLLLGIK